MCNSEMTIIWAWIFGKGECISYVEHIIIFKEFYFYSLLFTRAHILPLDSS